MQPWEDGSVGWLGLGATALWELLDRMRVGVVVLDGVGGVLGRNAVAHGILATGDALLERDGVLDAPPVPGRDLVRRFVESVCRGECSPEGRALAVSREGKRRALEIVGLPLARPATVTEGEPVPAALLLVHDPEAPSRCARDGMLRDLYRLTPAEARVAALLLDGLGVDDVARALTLSRHTVRTHVKHVLAKTGTRSQTELVRLVLSGPLGLLRAAGDAPPA